MPIKNKRRSFMRRKLAMYLLFIFTFTLLLTPTYAKSNIDSIKNTETVIQELFTYVNQQNWQSYLDLLAKVNQDDMKLFLNNSDNKKNGIGLFNIKTAKVEEIQFLPDNVVSSFTKLSQYKDEYNEVESFLVGIYFEVKNENKYYFNGVNYRLVVVGKENNAWKVIEISDAPIERLIPLGYGFNNENEKKALKIVQERIKGNIINSTGETIKINKASYRDIQLEKGLYPNDIQEEIALKAIDDHNRPDNVRVYRTSLGYTQTVELYYYVKNVLPNEWIGSWPDESLRVGAMDVKMYGWYHVYHPKWPALNADVKDNNEDQTYVPNSEYTKCTTAINYVGGIGLENSDGDVFEAQYLAGSYGTSGQYSGKVNQWGTKYWADKGTKTYMQMLHYYYDYSNKSSGQISTFTY
jgi:hypothetical protein